MMKPSLVIEEIKDGATQESVALSYAWLLRDGCRDLKAVNLAILERWSLSGLERVKRKAWKLLGVS